MNRRRKPNQQPNSRTSTKARSLRHPRNFFLGIFFAAVHYLSLFAFLTCLVLFVKSPHLSTAKLLLGSVVLAILTWIIAYFRRKAAVCPLCKGTPLINSGALPHPNAVRLRPLNYGVTAVLSALFTHHFRCMYCGSRYDLLRQPRDYRHSLDEQEPGDTGT
jgi:hypothetical protein